MKRGAVFYNIGRGTTVDQSASLAALESGQVRHAYLDVTDPEPLPAGHGLWSHPNCLITPHTAGGHVDESRGLRGIFWKICGGSKRKQSWSAELSEAALARIFGSRYRDSLPSYSTGHPNSRRHRITRKRPTKGLYNVY